MVLAFFVGWTVIAEHCVEMKSVRIQKIVKHALVIVVPVQFVEIKSVKLLENLLRIVRHATSIVVDVKYAETIVVNLMKTATLVLQTVESVPQELSKDNLLIASMVILFLMPQLNFISTECHKQSSTLTLMVTSCICLLQFHMQFLN